MAPRGPNSEIIGTALTRDGERIEVREFQDGRVMVQGTRDRDLTSGTYLVANSPSYKFAWRVTLKPSADPGSGES